jgi:hypothetical protein
VDTGKGHLTGKPEVSDELAALFQPGAEIKVFTFPNTPKPKAQTAPELKPAA